MSRTKTKIVLLAIVAILVLIAAVIIWDVIGSHMVSKGTTDNSTLSTTDQTVQFNASPIIEKGTYASFSYPASLRSVTGDRISPPIVASYNYIFSDTQTWELGITILDNSGGIMGTSDYQFRLSRPSEYQKTTETFNQNTDTIFTDTTDSNFSEVAFFQHADQVAEISLIGNDIAGPARLQQTLNLILSSWHWNEQ